jgi:hypothetical protein
MSRYSSFTFSFLFCFLALFFTLPAWSAVVIKSDGTVTIMQNGVQSTGAENVGGTLPPGTIVTTGENGKTLLEVAPGITIELQPNTQITIGETVPDKGTDALGNPIPEVYVTLTVGSIICDTQGAAGAASLVVQTARGTISPVTPGVMVISSTGADPTMATVTVAALVGDKLAVTTEGEQVPVGEGLVVILRPDGMETGSLTDYPNLSGNVPIPLAPPVPLPPPDRPTSTPTPTPNPTPTPPPVSP